MSSYCRCRESLNEINILYRTNLTMAKEIRKEMAHMGKELDRCRRALSMTNDLTSDEEDQSINTTPMDKEPADDAVSIPVHIQQSYFLDKETIVYTDLSGKDPVICFVRNGKRWVIPGIIFSEMTRHRRWYRHSITVNSWGLYSKSHGNMMILNIEGSPEPLSLGRLAVKTLRQQVPTLRAFVQMSLQCEEAIGLMFDCILSHDKPNSSPEESFAMCLETKRSIMETFEAKMIEKNRVCLIHPHCWCKAALAQTAYIQSLHEKGVTVPMTPIVSEES